MNIYICFQNLFSKKMSAAKNQLSGILRKTGLLYAADYLKFLLQKCLNYARNKGFRNTYPSFALPPDYHLYETFTLDYGEYKYQGELNASELVDLISTVADLDTPGKKILDWGCGPARVVRHLPSLLAHKHEIYATDYNKDYINWCSHNLRDIVFSSNGLNPPLVFAGNYFDIIYSISILTHLSEKNHYEWIGEINRILKPGGILIITTQGNAYKTKMLDYERIKFERGELVTRSYSKEGHRIYSAFQPPAFMKQLFSSFEIIEYQDGAKGESIHGEQDTWVVRKEE